MENKKPKAPKKSTKQRIQVKEADCGQLRVYLESKGYTEIKGGLKRYEV